MLLSEIWIYPVKSLGGIRQKQALVEEKGLQYDRRWMIVDEKGKFLTQRVNVNMALLDVAIHAGGLVISHRNQSDNQILVPFKTISNQTIQVKVWDDILLARTVCDQADNWLSSQLGKKVRIVEMSEQTQRNMDPTYSGKESLVSFADDFPYLLISEGSLKDLNSRLDQPVTMKRFRPNFVISDTEPFAEDSWKKVKIGQVEFIVAKPCERCVLVSIDPITGQKGPEPLKTLSNYRKVDKNIFFGQNLVSLQNGLLHEGDELVISLP
ncbi:MAG: MOSC N-terminal beta barrel domain-containing protein [Dyadobacter sp.]